MTVAALEVSRLNKRFGGLPATQNVSIRVMPGERRLTIGPNAERITVLHYGQVIVEGTRAEVVADPRTKEVYLGH